MQPGAATRGELVYKTAYGLTKLTGYKTDKLDKMTYAVQASLCQDSHSVTDTLCFKISDETITDRNG